MRSRNEVLAAFTYHPPKPEQVPVYNLLRGVMKETALVIFDHLPESPERTLALRRLHEASMHANAAVALHGVREA